MGNISCTNLQQHALLAFDKGRQQSLLLGKQALAILA
jgi:hypothetical protein